MLSLAEKPGLSVSEFRVSGISLGMDERAVRSKWGKPKRVNINDGIEFLCYNDRRLPARAQGWNSYVGLNSSKNVVDVCGSVIAVRGQGLNSYSDHSDVIAVFRSLGAPRAAEDQIERVVYGMHYNLRDGSVTIYFHPSGRGTSFSLSNRNP